MKNKVKCPTCFGGRAKKACKTCKGVGKVSKEKNVNKFNLMQAIANAITDWLK